RGAWRRACREHSGRRRLLRAAEGEHQPVRETGRLVALLRRRDDPYWDFYINTPPAEPANLLRDVMRNAPEGNVFPTKADLHTPEVTTTHVKEMARYLGADLVGVTRLDGDDAGHPFAIVCAVRADDDPRRARGIGGQIPVQNGLFVTFVLSAWIRELGFR